MNIPYYWNLNENPALSRACPLSYLGAASCKQLQNHFSAQLQNPSCDACKKPWQCLGYSCTETAVYHVYKYCLIPSHTISSACTICCLLWHVQAELFTTATEFSSVLVRHLAQLVFIPQGHNNTENLTKLMKKIPLYLFTFLLAL